MRKQDLLPLLASLGVQPSRRLGQNFLVDQNMLDVMVKDANPTAGEQVLEVGPGTGVLTRRLIASGCQLTAVEFDHRLASYLRETLGKEPNFRLIEGDACKQDYDSLMGIQTWRCIANLPYACSSVFIAKLLECKNQPEALFVLLQYEMGRRLAAHPGTEDYGALSVQVQLFYKVDIIRKVPPGVFYPPPEVDSAFVRLQKKEVLSSLEDARLAIKLAKIGFSQRRKKMGRLLEKEFSKERIQKAFQALGLSEDIRAERLSPEMWNQLAKELSF